MTSPSLRVLIVGYGSMGRRHFATAMALGHDVLITDPFVTPPRSLFVDDWRGQHAIVIASPAKFHAAHIARALGNQQHVFVEKPLALSVVQAEQACLGWTPGVTTQVGYNWRFSPVLQSIKALPDVWERGDFWIRCDMRTWPGKSYGDALLECSHEIDLALWLLGPATVFRASCDPMLTRWDLDLQHPDLAGLSHVTIDTAYAAYERGFTLHGRDRTITYTWDPARGEAAVVTSPARNGKGTILTQISVEETYTAELTHFLARAAYAEPTDCPFSDGLAVLSICDAARRFARTT